MVRKDVNEDKLKKIRNKIENIKNLQGNIPPGVFLKEVVEGIFLEEMGYSKKEIKISSENREKYSINIDHKLLIKISVTNKLEKEIYQFQSELENEIEWGIFFHPTGIWLFNSNVRINNKEDFKSKKIVLEVIYGKNKDQKYFKYFSYDNILGIEKNACFFKDFISYKNTIYSGAKKSWNAYHSALKRFFDFYAENIDDYSRYGEKSYDYVWFSHFVKYLREGTNIQSLKTVKNAFFYIKDFMCNASDNGEFERSSEELLTEFQELSKGETISKNAMDMDKLKCVLDFLEKSRNSTRNEVLFLLLLSFGIERRKICSLEWERNIDVVKGKLILDDSVFPIPKWLNEKLLKLREEQPNARYVFGNNRKGYYEPLNEGAVNTMLLGIAAIDSNDKFYKQLNPANIRRWLAKYLLKKGYSLEEIMYLMKIELCNLSSYITVDDIEKAAIQRQCILKKHPMENFLEELREKVYD